MRRRSRKNQIDKHDMPTEPLLDIPAVLFPTSERSSFMPVDRTVPMPFPPHLDPQQPPGVYPYAQAPSFEVDRYPYPFLSDIPARTTYGASPTVAAWYSGNTKIPRTSWRTFLPACAGLLFVCVQLLLVVRFVVRFLKLSPALPWVGFVTDVSEFFVLPVRTLWLQIPSVSTLFPATIEIYTLIAVLIYGMLSRLLVYILKVMFNSR